MGSRWPDSSPTRPPTVYFYDFDGPPVAWRPDAWDAISIPQNHDADVATPPSGYITIYYSLDNLDGDGNPQLWAKAGNGSTYQQH
jgi:hypothetical protein